MNNKYNETYKTIRILSKSADLDERYGPWDSITEANSNIPLSVREPGLTIGIYIDTNVIKEYWYNGGILSTNLVPKNEAGEVVVLQEDIIADFGIGGIEEGELIPSGTTFTNFIKKLVKGDNFSDSTVIYINTNPVPITIGGYIAGQPATPPDGLDIQQAIDKFLFPAVNPTISNFVATPQPEFNQPTPYNINVSWGIVINSVGADIDTLTLEWRRGTSGAFTALAVNNNDTSFVHQITSVSNVNIQYRLTVVDTQGASQSTTITRNIENYAAPTGSLTKIPSPNIIERGVNTTLNGSVTRNRQHAIISNVKFQKRINNGSWITEEEFDSVDLGTLINITEFISNNGNNDSKVYFRLLVTDSGNSNDNQIAYTSTDLILPYFYGKSSSDITPNQGLFDDVNTSKVLASSEGTVSIVFNASAEFLWFATPEGSTTKTNWFVTALNAGDIGGSTNLWASPITLSIESPDGLWTQNYKIYVTNSATSTANGVAMELRN